MQNLPLSRQVLLVLSFFTLAAGCASAQTNLNDVQILNKILDSANSALRINAVAGGGGGGPAATFLTSSQIYNLVYDSSNNALKVNLIAGGGGGGGGGISSLNALTAATQTLTAASSGCVDFTISSAGSTHTFCIPNASLSARGLLSSADWTTFNAKENALTFNAPFTRSANTVSMPAASGTQTGYLSSADWNTFNSKQNALAFPLGLAQGGTNQTVWAANRCVRVNSAGNALEPAGADCGSSSSGITNLNGLTVATQSFLIGTAGVSPNWVSATSTHTLNIPLASAAGVTAGLIGKADYDAFSAKENSLTFTSPLSRSTNTISCPTCELTGNKGAANGYAPLNATSQVPAANLPPLSGTGTCTNQFVRGLNDKVAPACSYVTATDVNTTIEVTANKNQANGYAGLDASSRIATAQAPATTAYTDVSNTFSAGTQDFSGAAATRPFRRLAFASFPTACIAGQDMLVRTDPATAGQVIYICNAAGNGWVLVGDGGSGGAVSSVFARTGAVTAQAGDYTASQVTNAFDTTTFNDVTEVATPSGNPSAGKLRFYAKTSTEQMCVKNSGGTETCYGAGGGGVSSIFGRTGAVAAQAGDYTVAQVTNALSAAPTADQTIQGSADVSFIVKQANVANIKNPFEIQLKAGTKSFYIDPNGDVHYTGSLIGDGSGVTVSTFTEGAPPSNPASGKCVEYVDSTTHTWKFINSSGANCLDLVSVGTHNLLSPTHPDTTVGTVARGDLITGQGATPKWTRLAKGTANQCLLMDGTGTDVIWGTCPSGGGNLGDPGGNGIIVRTSLNTTTARTLTAGSTKISISNGDGTTGNPTIDIGAGVSQTIQSNVATMGTASIASGACATVVTVSALGVATTDVIIATPNVDPTGVTGYGPSANGSLYIQAYPTAGNVNFKVCNNTVASITPAALTLNWRVIR